MAGLQLRGQGQLQVCIQGFQHLQDASYQFLLCKASAPDIRAQAEFCMFR